MEQHFESLNLEDSNELECWDSGSEVDIEMQTNGQEDLLGPGFILPELLELVFQYLGPNDLLKCRRVSPCWRSEVDKFLDKEGVQPQKTYFPLHHLLQPNSERQDVFLSETVIGTRFRNEGDITKFISQMGDRETNPFPNHCVVFVSNWNGDLVLDGIEDLLVKFGDFVKQCFVVLEMPSCPEASDTVFNSLKQIMRFKNLELLSVFRHTYPRVGTQDSEFVRFPHLNKLKHLQVFGFCYGRILQMILASQSHRALQNIQTVGDCPRNDAAIMSNPGFATVRTLSHVFDFQNPIAMGIGMGSLEQLQVWIRSNHVSFERAFGTFLSVDQNYASKLKMISLRAPGFSQQQEMFPVPPIVVQSAMIPYPNVTHISLSYQLLNRLPYLVDYLAYKCKTWTIMELWDVRNKQEYIYAKRLLWLQLPPSVKTIINNRVINGQVFQTEASRPTQYFGRSLSSNFFA